MALSLRVADAVRCQQPVNHATVCCPRYFAIRNDSLPTIRTTFVAPLCSQPALSTLCSPACGGCPPPAAGLGIEPQLSFGGKVMFVAVDR
jgi:hypothetical protein